MGFLRLNPEASNFFVALSGTQSGTHEYFKNPNGKADYKRIVDNESGAVVRNFSNREMARAISEVDGEIYERLYPFLSSYSHVSLDAEVQYFEIGGGFHVHKDDDPFMALEFTNIIIAFWLAELARVDLITKKTKRDLRYMINRIVTLELALVGGRAPTLMPPLMKLILQRLQEAAQ